VAAGRSAKGSPRHSTIPSDRTGSSGKEHEALTAPWQGEVEPEW